MYKFQNKVGFCNAIQMQLWYKRIKTFFSEDTQVSIEYFKVQLFNYCKRYYNFITSLNDNIGVSNGIMG